MTSYSFARRAVSAVNVAVTLQLGLMAASVGRGMGIFEPKSSLLDEQEVFDANHYHLVQDYLSYLYSNPRIPPPQEGVKFAESATWENPKCIFRGASEIQQGFRIPAQDQAQTPRCVDVEPKGESIILTYVMPYKNDDQGSLVVVTVEMHQMKNSPEFNEFVITKMVEKWNGIPLFQSMLFWIVRRINGFVAFHFSRGLGW